MKDGIDEKIINPVLAQIRQHLQFVQHLTEVSKDFISKSTQVIQQNIETTTELVNKSPKQARFYIEKNIIEPILTLMHQAIEITNRYIKTTQNLMVQKIILPSQSIYDHGIEAVLALPSQSQIIFQVWIAEPALQSMQGLSDFGHRLSDDSMTELKNLLIRIKNFIDQGLAAIAEQVKKSPFWDGKRSTESIA
jgi:hypothetical protein